MLAYQLIRTIPSIRERVLRAVRTDPLIFSRSMETQLNVLVCEPLRRERSCLRRIESMLVVIDGVDECDDGIVVLKAFTDAIERGSFPFKLLIRSRTRADLRAGFDLMGAHHVLAHPIVTFPIRYKHLL
jgi:hypothetical protein